MDIHPVFSPGHSRALQVDPLTFPGVMGEAGAGKGLISTRISEPGTTGGRFREGVLVRHRCMTTRSKHLLTTSQDCTVRVLSRTPTSEATHGAVCFRWPLPSSYPPVVSQHFLVEA